MIKTNSKGFTLIELLVVIAIIGILSTIAMTSLNGARKKAADASFKSTVTSIQAIGVLCCDAATPTLRGTVGTAVDLSTQTICTDTSVAGSYAASTAIGNVTLVSQCSGGAFSITVAKPANFAGNLASGTCTETQCTFA